MRLHTICGRNTARVEKGARNLAGIMRSTIGAVVTDPEIDVIDINTPNDSHAEIAIAAAKAGKHVLCQPLALDVKECQMLQAVKRARSCT